MTASRLLESINSPADLRRLERKQLPQLATELRAFLIESVSQTGGHLSSNLGTVELTIALHAVFNTPEDRLVWDVGHQCYAHKVLTGRREGMKRLRIGDSLTLEVPAHDVRVLLFNQPLTHPELRSQLAEAMAHKDR